MAARRRRRSPAPWGQTRYRGLQTKWHRLIPSNLPPLHPKAHLCAFTASAYSRRQRLDAWPSHAGVNPPFIYLSRNVFIFCICSSLRCCVAECFPSPLGDSECRWGSFAGMKIIYDKKKKIMFAVHILQVSSALLGPSRSGEKKSSATGGKKTVRLPGRITIYLN